MQNYSVNELRTVFIEMFCKTKASADNPMMQPTGAGQRRSLRLKENLKAHLATGQKIQKMELQEGFLDALEDAFWIYNDANYGSEGAGPEKEKRTEKRYIYIYIHRFF